MSLAHRKLAQCIRIVSLTTLGLLLAMTFVGSAAAVTDQLRSSYGGASHLLAPISQSAAEQGTQTARSIGLESGTYCDRWAELDGVPGRVRVREIDPHDAIASSTLYGQFQLPESGQALVSPSVEQLLAGAATVTIDGVALEVTGVAQNPDALGDRMVVVAPESIVDDDGAACALMLVSPTDAEARKVMASASVGNRLRTSATESGASSTQPVGWLVSAVALILVSLLARGGFSAIHEQVEREASALVAIGAAPRRVARAIGSFAVVLGLVGAALGVGLGLVSARWAANHVARTLDHAPLHGRAVPTSLIVALSATTAAWCYVSGSRAARQLRRSTTGPVSTGQRPGWRGTRIVLLSLIGGVVAAYAGAFGLIRADATAPEDSIVAVLLLVLAPLLLLPTVVAIPVALTRRGGVTAIAVRDLARHRSRFVPSLVAGSFALGVGLASLVTLSIARETASTTPSVRPEQVVLSGASGFDHLPEPRLNPAAAVPSDAVDHVVSLLGPGTRKAPLLRVAAPPSIEASPFSNEVAYLVGMIPLTDSDGYVSQAYPIYIATEELLDLLNLDLLVEEQPQVSLYTGHTVAGGETGFVGLIVNDYVVHHVAELTTTVAPAVLISEADASRIGEVIEVGYLLVTDEGLGPSTRRDIEAAAAALDLYVELPPDLERLRGLEPRLVGLAALVGALIGHMAARIVASACWDSRVALLRLGLGPAAIARIHVLQTAWLSMTMTMLAVPLGLAPLIVVHMSSLESVISVPYRSMALVAGVVLTLPPLVAAIRGPASERWIRESSGSRGRFR